MTAPDWHSLGRALVSLGLILVGSGVLLALAAKLSWLGRLPGDLVIRRDGFTLYVPLASSLLASVLISLVIWLIGRHRP